MTLHDEIILALVEQLEDITQKICGKRLKKYELEASVKDYGGKGKGVMDIVVEMEGGLKLIFEVETYVRHFKGRAVHYADVGQTLRQIKGYRDKLQSNTEFIAVIPSYDKKYSKLFLHEGIHVILWSAKICYRCIRCGRIFHISTDNEFVEPFRCPEPTCGGKGPFTMEEIKVNFKILNNKV